LTSLPTGRRRQRSISSPPVSVLGPARDEFSAEEEEGEESDKMEVEECEEPEEPEEMELDELGETHYKGKSEETERSDEVDESRYKAEEKGKWKKSTKLYWDIFYQLLTLYASVYSPTPERAREDSEDRPSRDKERFQTHESEAAGQAPSLYQEEYEEECEEYTQAQRLEHEQESLSAFPFQEVDGRCSAATRWMELERELGGFEASIQRCRSCGSCLVL